MQLKATKLVALLSRLRLAPLALALVSFVPFGVHAAGSLPAGYTRLDFIESTVEGSQYIEIPSEIYHYENVLSNEVKIVGEFTASSADKWQSPCGFSTEGWSNLALRPSNNQGAEANKFGNEAFKDSGGGLLPVTFNSMATIVWAFGGFANGGDPRQSLKVTFANGETQLTAANTRLNDLMDANKPLTLFAVRRNSDDSMWNFSNFRLYGLTVKLNGTLKADFVPALNPSGVPGLYDTVTGRFLTNQGSSQFIYPKPNQWVRFTITKKNKNYNSPTWGINECYVQLDEFGLYSAEGIQQNLGLKFANDPSAIAPGYFYLNKGNAGNPTNLFLAGTVKWCYSEHGTLTALEAGGTDYLVFTMHLRDDAAPVVKYNLRSGDDTYQIPGRAPVCWKVETSDNGIDWVVRDEQADEATSGYTTANNTWYGGGGNGDAPTTFYVLQPIEHPLPAGYTRLEWIKSTRQQRLVTDYYPNPKTWMEVDCMFTGLFDGDGGSFESPNCTSRFCDANEGVAPYSIAFTGSRGYFNELILWMAKSSLNPADSESGSIVIKAVTLPQAGDKFAAVDESVCRNLLTISNGVSNSTLEWSTAKADHVETPKRTIPRKSTTCTKRLALFGTADLNFGTYDMTVWSWKIYESDSGSGVNDPTSHLVHNFIPAMDPDGVPGLWDTVTGEFRASASGTPFEYKNADQWFRLKITQVAPGKELLTFSEFALYDAEGVRQNLGLTKASSIDHIGSGQFFHDARGGTIWGDSPSEALFDGVVGKVSKKKSMMGMTLPGGTYDKTTGEITDPQVLIMHLKSGANEVVKYNLASGDYAADCSPRGWILERSYDGRNWTEIIRKTMTTIEYPIIGCAWYRDGGDTAGSASDDGIVEPTTFYPAGNWGEGANQWFRLTIRKKYGASVDEKSLQLDEFALFDAEGKRQDLGLEPNGVSAASLLPGEWYYEGRGDAAGNPTKFFENDNPAKEQSPSKLFDANLATKWGVDYGSCDLNPLGQGDEAYWQVLTLRLPVGTSEVVSYNLCSGHDTASWNSRAPTSWVLERSSDGINWVVFDEKTEADHQYTLESSTWYGNGGKDEDPTNVFWIVKLPLPKLGQTVYSYTGAPISPKMMEESEFYTLSGDTNATNEGTYKLVCTPISGLTWANGSTGPYELVWQIVPETFLQRVASDPKRVDNKPGYDNQYATGGDIVLQIGNEYVHVFTNGTDRTFTAKTDLANARLLLVGGGGSGGLGWNGFSGAGGGAGGLVEMVTSLSQETYQVKVGIGAQSVTDVTHPRGKNGSDSLFSRMSGDAIALAQGGGGGGSSAISYVGSGKNSNCDLAIGLSGGSGGGHSVLYEDYIDENFPSADWYSPAPGVDGQGYAGGMAYINTASAQGCSGAGGGGAGGAGAACTKTTVGGVGGVGRVSDILGWSAFFAGGGAGAAGNINFAESSNGGVGGGGSSCSREILTNATYAAKRPLIMDGSNGQGGGGAGAVSREMNVVGDSGKGGSGIVIIRYQIPNTTLQATPPVAKTGLTYNGKTQVGVPEGVGYTLKEAYYYATDVGTYTTTATLLPGYEWNDDGNKTAPRDYEWTIEGLRISSVKLVANEAQWTGGDITPQVASVTTVDGLTITDASVGWDVAFERERVATTDFKQVGNISVVVTGTGSLSGQARANFRIYDPKKIPLPKPSLAVYKYTGFAITPSFDPSWARDGYEKSGTLSAIEKGTYTVTCTLNTGYTWENGSTMPYDVQWVIGDSFLERLASDPRRVNGALVTNYDTGYAVGGDLVLFDSETSEYIHVFTNTADAATFTPSANLNARVLLVGGGGGGGGENGGGGGAGGMVEDAGLLLPGNQDITVVVGKGAAGVNAGVHGDDGTSSQIVVPGVKPVVAYGGGGGGAAQWNAAVDHNVIDGHGGNGFGSGGGGSSCSGSAIAVGLPGLSTTTYNDVKQGNDGGAANDNASYPAGGGGGAGEPGETSDSYNRKSGRHYESGENIGGFGGNGRVSDILGAEFTEQYFAGGGGGGGGDGSLERVAKGGMGGGGNGAEGDYSSTPLRAAKVAQPGENGLGGGGGGGKGGQSSSYLKKGAAGGDGIVIIRYSAPNAREVAPVPESWLTVRKLFANGKTQVGVESASRGSTLSGDYYGDAAGTYTAVATLAPGYTKWADDSTALSREIEWEIYVPSVVASAEDVEQEYDGTSHSITVTVTDPADATVTYSLTEDGVYTPSNPSFTEFGAYRVYWKASKDNYTGAKGSAVVRIGKKAAGEYVRLRITQRTGGTISGHTNPPGEYSVSIAELALYSDAAGTSRFGTGLNLASDLNNLKTTPGTCFCTLPDREPNYISDDYSGKTIVRLFDQNSSTHNCCEGCDFKVEDRKSPNAHLIVYMHLSAADAAKVIRSYDLQSPMDVNNEQNRAPTAWRLEVSSDCEHWTVIDEKTVDDTAGNAALTQNSKWYGKDGSDDKKAYQIEFGYAPLEYLDTNPYAETDPQYETARNYIQIVGFRLEADDVVTTKVRYNDNTGFSEDPTDKHFWDTIFSQRDSTQNGMFSVFRYIQPGLERLRFDYGASQGQEVNTKLTGECEFVASASGVMTNGFEAIKSTGTAWSSMPDNSLLLFAVDDSNKLDGVPNRNWAYLKCYYFKVADSASDSADLRLDLMPASNTVTHAHGLYDRVSGNFYPLQAIAEAGQQPFTSATIASHYAKPMTVKMNDAGWNQLPILTEVDERLASVTNYLTSIPNYWQQEWVPGVVDHAGEYRQILRGQGPYAGEVTNVYAVGIEVALNANGGTAGATNSVLAVPGRPLPAITGEGALPTMTDSMFAGYWSEQTGGEKYYNADGTSAKDYPATDGPTTLYAHWRQGIKPLAKLNFDGKHFILTDYVPQETTWIETEMQAKQNGTSSSISDQSFFGLAETHEIDSSSYTLYYSMNYAGYSAQIYGWALSTGNNEGKGRGWNLSASDGAMLNSGKCLVRFGYSGFEVSNQTSGIKEATQDPRMNMLNYFPCTSTLVIGGLGGALPNASSGSKPGYGRPVQPYKSNTSSLDVYSFKIYESENGSPDDAEQTLVRDYIPVTNTIAKVAGLYDVINEVFYPLKTQTIVTLNANGGNQPTNYVYATAGEAMPSPIEVPTRPGYTFKGYVEKWEARLMTGDDTDICNEGASEFAMMIGTPPASPCSINGVNFVQVTRPASFDRMPMPNLNLAAAACETEDKGNSGYGQLLNGCLWGGGLSYSFELKELTPGHVYLFQFFVHDGSTLYGRRDFKVSVDNVNWYSVGCDPAVSDPTRSRYGVTFIHRFEAQSATESVTIYYKDDYVVFNGAQLRDITEEPSANVFYYNSAGTSDKTYPAANGPTTLYAQWELANYPITYEGLEGADNPDNPTGYTVNDELVLRAPGKRDGYVFGGWWENDVQISYIPTNTTGAKTLTANWVSTNDYQLIEYIATTNCQFLDTGVTPRNAHFGFALDFWDQCYVRWDETDSPYISPDATSNLAKIMGTATNHRGEGQFSGFCFGNWNRQSDRKGQLVLCCDYNASSESINPMLKSDSRLRVKMVNDYNPTGCTPTKDTSYSKYTVKGVSPDGTEAPVAETCYRHHIASGIDVYQDMPEWFAGSVYVGAVNRESTYQNPDGLGYGGTRNNYMRFYRVTFYYDDIVLYDAIPAIDSNGHVGLLRVDGAEGELFAYSKTIQEDWTTAHPEDVGAEFATPFFKVNGNGGSPEETTIVKYVDQPALTVDQIPERDGFTLMGFTNATGRVYQLDGDNKFVDVPQDGETVYARWFASGDFEILPCLDNGESLDAAGYVVLTNFHLTGENVVELKYNVNETVSGYENIFMSRQQNPGLNYGLVLTLASVNPNEYGLTVAYGSISNHADIRNSWALGKGSDVALRICPKVGEKLSVTNVAVNEAITWQTGHEDKLMTGVIESEFPHDVLLFTADHPDKRQGEPSRLADGRLSGPALAKMYYFRVENSATDPTLRLDLVPVRKTATGVRGFYDLVSGNFYPLKTPVVLDGNGGTPSPQYVYTSKGEAMPELPNGEPTRPGYDFKGYYDATEGGTQYYGADGSVKAASCDFGEGTTLYAQWEVAKYHVINPVSGPEIVVKYEWVTNAYGSGKSKAEYQQALFTTNQYGVVNWQAYVLGFAADEVDSAAILEESVQNTYPETVTIRLRDWEVREANKRTAETGCTLKYTLLSARTPGELMTGGGTVVTNESECADGYYKWPKSTFEAPLSDLDDENPVNYYRIKVHFIFGGGGEVLLESAGVVTTTTPGWTASGNDMIADVTLPDSFAAGGKYLKVEFKGAADYAMGLQAVIFLNADGKEISTVNDGLYTNDRSSPFAYTHAYRVPVGASRVQVKFTPSTRGSDPTQASIQIADVVLSSISETEACAVEEAAFNQMDTALLSTVEGSTMPSAETLKANLPGLVNALKNGTEYKILMLTCPLSTYLNSGLLEEMVRNAFPGSKIKFSYYTRGSNDCAEYFEADLDESTGVFSGSKMSVSMMDVDCIMMHSASYYRITSSTYHTDLGNLIDKCKRVKSDVEFVFVSPLYSVESRFDWGDVGLASYEAGPLYSKFGQTPWPYADKANDQWVIRSHPTEARTNVKNTCSNKAVGYWELYDVAYDYVWRSEKPIGWFNQGNFGGYQLNERGRQLNVHILIDAFKRLAACSD